MQKTVLLQILPVIEKGLGRTVRAVARPPVADPLVANVDMLHCIVSSAGAGPNLHKDHRRTLVAENNSNY